MHVASTEDTLSGLTYPSFMVSEIWYNNCYQSVGKSVSAMIEMASISYLLIKILFSIANGNRFYRIMVLTPSSARAKSSEPSLGAQWTFT